MVSSVKILDPYEEIICDRLYDAHDPHLQFSSVSDAHNSLSSPSEGQSELLGNLKPSLVGFALEQFPHFLDMVHRESSNYSATGKAILDDTHSHFIWKITPEAIRNSLGLFEAQC